MKAKVENCKQQQYSRYDMKLFEHESREEKVLNVSVFEKAKLSRLNLIPRTTHRF